MKALIGFLPFRVDGHYPPCDVEKTMKKRIRLQNRSANWDVARFFEVGRGLPGSASARTAFSKCLTVRLLTLWPGPHQMSHCETFGFPPPFAENKNAPNMRGEGVQTLRENSSCRQLVSLRPILPSPVLPIANHLSRFPIDNVRPLEF